MTCRLFKPSRRTRRRLARSAGALVRRLCGSCFFIRTVLIFTLLAVHHQEHEGTMLPISGTKAINGHPAFGRCRSLRTATAMPGMSRAKEKRPQSTWTANNPFDENKHECDDQVEEEENPFFPTARPLNTAYFFSTSRYQFILPPFLLHLLIGLDDSRRWDESP